MVRPTGKAKWG